MNRNRIGKTKPSPYWSPYLAGFGLGLTLLFSYWLLGTGLGASGGLVRISAWLQHLAAPLHVESSPYFGRWFGDGTSHVLAYYLVITPTALLKRVFGGRPLPTRPDRDAASYWVTRPELAQPKERFIKRY